VRSFFCLASRLGDGPLWYLLIFAPLSLDREQGIAATANLALVGGIAALLYRRLKRWAKRPRPFAADPRIRAWIAPLDEYSFPSGHTLHAVSFTVVACAWYPWLAWVLAPFSVCIALSRVVLGVHYPSDVAAAAIIGGALGAGSLSLF
jgi:undecaprenyl-diphosphatase